MYSEENFKPKLQCSNWCLVLFVITILLFSLAIISGLKHETADEGFHTPIIFEYFNGNFIVSEHITMLPVYHALLAGIMSVFDYISVKSLRLVNLIVSGISIPVFYWICVRLKKNAIAERVLIFTLMPIILPFFSLIYTDMAATCLVLAMVLLMLHRNHYWAAFFGLFAVFLRQTNLIWVGFCGLYLVVECWFSSSGLWKDRALSLVPLYFSRLLPYALVFIIFGAFVIYNGGIAVGTADLQSVSFNPSNVYYFLLLTFFLFLPYNLEYSYRVFNLLKSSPVTWVVVGVFFVVYFITYSNSHQFNSYGLSFYIRNIILHHTVTNPAWKFLAFIPMAWMMLTFYLMGRQSSSQWQMFTLYFVTLINLIPLPLVEQRYYIVALVLFLAWKPNTSEISDKLTIFIYIPTSAFLLYGISQHWFFL